MAVRLSQRLKGDSMREYDRKMPMAVMNCPRCGELVHLVDGRVAACQIVLRYSEDLCDP